jgi:hypothetical protein
LPWQLKSSFESGWPRKPTTKPEPVGHILETGDLLLWNVPGPTAR